MLNQQTLNSLYPMVSNLESQGLGVTPVAGSVLDELCRASCTDDSILNGNAQDGWSVYMPEVASNTNSKDPVLGVVKHDDLMAMVVPKVLDAVSRQLALVRTQVVPVIEDFVKRVQAPLAAAAHNPMSDFEIRITKLPAPLLESALTEQTALAKDIPLDMIPSGVGLPPTSPEDIRKMVQTGATGLDRSVTEMLSGMTDERVQTLFTSIFGPGVGRPLNSYLDEQGPEASVFAYLIARKYWDDPVEGVELPLETYRKRMLAVRDQSAKMINGVLYVHDRDVNAGILIRRSTKNSVEVNERVYKDWIAAGGRNETLFGAVVSGSPEIRVEKINEKLDYYSHAWATHKAMNATAEANKRFIACKGVARAEFNDTIVAMTQDQLPVADRVAVVQKFDEELACTTQEELQCVDNWVMRLITKSIYQNTSAYEILSGMVRVRQINPDLDAKEAANVAAGEYVATWMAAQFRTIVITS